MARASLLSIVVGALAHGVCADENPESPTTDFTLAQIADGMELNWRALQNRSVVWIRLQVDRPELPVLDSQGMRIETHVREDGSWYEQRTSFVAGQPAKTEIEVWDEMSQLRQYPSGRDLGRVVQTYVRPESRLSNSVEKPFFDVPPFDLMRNQPSRIVGPVELEGRRCIRVVVDASALRANHPRWPSYFYLFDLDPERGFWPRRMFSGVQIPRDDVPYRYNVLDFINSDGAWYPKTVRLSVNGATHHFARVQSLDLNPKFAESLFSVKRPKPKPPSNQRSWQDWFTNVWVWVTLYAAISAIVLLVKALKRRKEEKTTTA